LIARLRRALPGALLVLLLGYAAIHGTIWLHARERLAHPPGQAADVALVLGNRAYRDGRPNPCLTGRVDAAVALARAGLVRQLVFSGGVDREDGRIEAEVMQQHARAVGYAGPLLLEPVSQSTRENLSMSRPLLEAAGVKRVIVISEPYHLWRVERLARATGFDRRFEVQYAAAPTTCWQRWGMAFRGALREPLAIVNNAVNGYLH
jgi:uncharacterized SAM-binding protein YcdF (DUF218 family)